MIDINFAGPQFSASREDAGLLMLSCRRITQTIVWSLVLFPFRSIDIGALKNCGEKDFREQ